jgi:signal transduction histidine kinase
MGRKKKNEPLEPGLLPIFRIFLLIQLFLTVAYVLIHMHLGQLTGDAYCVLAVTVVGILLLLAYLASRRLQSCLGRYYFPLALVLSVFISTLIQGELIESFIDPQNYSSEESVWQIFLSLYFPLILVAWQSNFGAVVGYSFLAVGLEALMLHFSNFEWFHQTAYQQSIFLRLIVFLATGTIISSIMKRQRKQRQELLAANRQLRHYAATMEQLAVTQERNRMARELHDTLAHTLSGLAVQLEAVRSLWTSAPERSYAMLEDSLQTTRTGLTESRHAIQALRASPLEDLGLTLALRNLAEDAASRAGVILNLELPTSLENLSPDVEQCLFRVAQEALENIVRYAEAKFITVRLVQAAKRLTLSIIDDGQGFDPVKVDAQDHLGLKGLRERVALFAGDLKIDSEPGQGTTISLELEQAQ